MNRFKRLDQKPEKTIIYSLTEPDTNKVRYIGKTKRPLDKRLQEHIRKATSPRHIDNTNKSKWIRELFERGKEPNIRPLDCETCSLLASNLEKKYIQEYSRIYKLYNEISNNANS